MDAVVKPLSPRPALQPIADKSMMKRPSREEAEAAVRTLIGWAGDDPDREGLRDTPRRVAKAYEELYRGYREDAGAVLARVFEEVAGYDDMVVVRDIPFTSHCEHHMVPFVGKAHVGYIPNGKVTGLSKLARVVEIYSKRLQVQEKLTAQIAGTIWKALNPQGVAVVIQARHFCMCYRGVRQPGAVTTTSKLHGIFLTNPAARAEFFHLLALKPDRS
jgi:GTP cyclohydrolase I